MPRPTKVEITFKVQQIQISKGKPYVKLLPGSPTNLLRLLGRTGPLGGSAPGWRPSIIPILEAAAGTARGTS